MPKIRFRRANRDMKHKLGNILLFLFTLILALAVRIGVWFSFFDRPDTFVQPDTVTYLEPGMHMLVNGSFPSFLRTPIYPLFLALVSKIMSSDPSILALVQIVISIASMGVIYRLCLRLFTFKTALIVLIFMALDLTSAISSNHLLSETLFTFLLSACLVALLRFQEWNGSYFSNLLFISLIGIGFSIIVLCRPIAFLLFVAVAFWLYLSSRKRKHHTLVIVLVYCAFSMLLPLSWVVRNNAHTGTFFLSTISSINLYEYRAAWNLSRIKNCSLGEAADELRWRAVEEKKRANLNEGELAKWKQAEAIKILMGSPFLTLYQGFHGLIQMYLGISVADIIKFSGTNEEDGLNNSKSLIIRILRDFKGRGFPFWILGIKIWAILYLILLYLGVAFSLTSIVKGRFSREQISALRLMIICIAYFTLFSVGAEAYSRFRVPIAPALSVLGGAGWAAILDNIRRYTTISEE